MAVYINWENHLPKPELVGAAFLLQVWMELDLPSCPFLDGSAQEISTFCAVQG